ncbi:hypothetical protein KCU65_g2602, partial [Aureobasidium melanogenum]
MSGMEVAGLVLGIIPLFISAIEHYEDGLRTVRVLKLVVYRQELAHYRTKLMTEYGLYSNALEELLVDVVTQQELRDMIDQGYGPLWKEAALEHKLRKRLGRTYNTYFLVMKQMQEVMARIASLLDIQRQGNITGAQLESLLLAHPPKHASPQNASHSTVYEFKKRLKFGFRSGQIQPLLEELGRYNNALYQFSESSRRLEGLRSTAPRTTFTTPIHHIRECAERLHRCLVGAWACSAHADHVIDLQLDSRICQPGLSEEAADERVLFSIAFLDSKLLNYWHCLEIYVLTGEPLPSQRQMGRVGFVTSTPTPSFDHSTLPTVRCLCTSVSTPQSQAHRTLCLDHNQRLLSGYSIASSNTHGQENRSGSTTNLEDVLSLYAASRRSRPFSSKQAYILGLTIASSFLQLRATPWLCGSWRAKNVLFIDESAADSIDFDKPYIRQTYPSCHQQQNPLQATAGADDSDDNCSFLNLGIMLLEIFFREPIDLRRTPADSGPNQSFSDLQTVRRWVQQDKEEMPIGFYKAVSFCIGCFASTNVDLQDNGFRQTVVDQVIVPLKDELKIWSA